MKIVHICNYYQPQLGYQDYFLPKYQIKAGHDVTVLTSDRYFPFPDYKNTVQSILGPRFCGTGVSEYRGIRIVRLKTLFEKSSRTILAGLNKKIKELKPDVVVCHGITNFNIFTALKYKKKLGYRLVFDEHTWIKLQRTDLPARLFYFFYKHLILKKILKKGDKLVSVSEGVSEFFDKTLGLKKSQYELLPLGSDTELYAFNSNERRIIRERFSIGPENFVVVYTGKVIKKKKIENIIYALDKAGEKSGIFSSSVLLVVGDGDREYFDFIKSRAEEKGVKLVYVVQQPFTELYKYYSAADVAVWPVEPTISTIDAMSCSLPVICNKGLTERYEKGNGFGVTPDDIDELAGCLLKLAEDSKLRARMGELSRETVEKELAWEVIARKFTDF